MPCFFGQASRLPEALNRGGNWIASSPDVEADIVAQFHTAQRLAPFSDWDDSQLRMALRQATDGELVPFLARLRTARLHGRFRRRLKTWVLRCNCNLRRPKRQCEPHQVIEATRRFTILIDQEWYRLAQWYHLPPDTVSAEREDVLHYFLHAAHAPDPRSARHGAARHRLPVDVLVPRCRRLRERRARLGHPRRAVARRRCCLRSRLFQCGSRIRLGLRAAAARSGWH